MKRFKKIAEPVRLSHNAHDPRPSSHESGAMIIHFDEIRKYKEKNEAVKQLQERTGLGHQDARDVIETLQNKDIGHCEAEADQPVPRSRHFYWFCLSFAAAGLIIIFSL